ncbi:MAG: PorT family protein [Dysgonamonadaceae bacterium]|jgi:hypothetical protein|nr:PorT family protein [Dysgonamonadaceae bacterium]
MKKLLAGISCLLLSLSGFGQENVFRNEWSFGVNAGMTLSNVRFSPSRPQDLLRQGSGGITVRYVSEKNFGLQAELNYTLRGWKERTDTVSNFNRYSRSLSYLEMPFMTYLYFDLGKRVRLIFNAGPQIGYNIGEKTLEKVLVPPADELDEDLHKRYYNQKIQHRFDYGITGGLGFELRTGAGNFILDGRYYFGLSDVFGSKKSDLFQASANQVIGVKITYLFDFQ